jgi:hypothetical protein
MVESGRRRDGLSGKKSSGRRLFIHAGTHKTGSTSIQSMLLNETCFLEENGTKVIYDHPGHGSGRTNCSSIAHAFIRPELFTPSRINGGQAKSFGSNEVIDYFLGQVTAKEYATYIISAEAFCYLRTRTERKLLEKNLKKLKCEVVPIIYFRNVMAWRKSWEGQMSIMPRTIKFWQLNSEKFTLLDDWYFDKEAIASLWRSISPSLITIDYDDELAKNGSIIPSFLDSVGLPQLGNSERYFANKSLSGAAIRNLNRRVR